MPSVTFNYEAHRWCQWTKLSRIIKSKTEVENLKGHIMGEEERKERNRSWEQELVEEVECAKNEEKWRSLVHCTAWTFIVVALRL